MSENYMYCLHCKEYTGTSDLKIVVKTTPKMGTVYSINGTCNDCRRLKSKRIGKLLPPDYSLESTEEQISKLLNRENKESKVKVEPTNQSNLVPSVISQVPKKITTGNSLEPTNLNPLGPAVIVATTTSEDVDGEGLEDVWNKIKSVGTKKTLADKIGDTAAKFTKSAVRRIPFVGDLLTDSGIVDSGIDWVSENIWQPIKKTFGWALDDVLKEKLKNDDTALQDIMEKMYEIKIKTGDGLVPTYIKELREGSTEDKALAHVLLKTLCKPKFYKFLKDENIPSSMSIIEAFTKYKSKPKTYKNQEEKAQQILSSLGYNFT